MKFFVALHLDRCVQTMDWFSCVLFLKFKLINNFSEATPVREHFAFRGSLVVPASLSNRNGLVLTAVVKKAVRVELLVHAPGQIS